MQVEGIIPKVEEGSEDEGAEKEESEDEEEGAEEEEFVNRGRHVFQMTARAPNGDIKEFNYIPGMCFPIKYILILSHWNLMSLPIYRTDFARCGSQHQRDFLQECLRRYAYLYNS